MEARAIVRNVRMTPRKIKLICDLIRGKDAGEAMAIIMNTPQGSMRADGEAPQERSCQCREQSRHEHRQALR